MAKQNVTHDPLFIGTDAIYPYHIRASDDPDAPALDVSLWTLSWMLKRSATDDDVAAIVVKTTGAGVLVAGTFNPDPVLNAQRIYVAVEDTDTDGEDAGLCVAELKRMDSGAETVLAHGPLWLRQANHHA